MIPWVGVLLAVIVLLVLSDEYGLIGILLAPPVAAAIQICAEQMWRATTRSLVAPPDNPTVSAQPIGMLQTRLALVHSQLAAQPESRPELNNLADRLEQLIEQAAQEEQRLTEAGALPQHFEVQSSAGTIG